MIQLITDRDLSFEKINGGMVKDYIESYYRAYGVKYDFCRFYTGDGILLLLYQDICYIAAGENADLSEAAQLIKLLSPSRVYTDIPGFSNRFRTGWKYQRMNYLERCYDSDIAGKSDIEDKNIPQFTEDYRAFYGCVMDSFQMSDDGYEAWYIDSCHLLRHDELKLAAIYNDGKIIATAAVNHPNSDSIYLSHFGVLPQYRGMGYAARFLNTLQQYYKKKIYLLCENELIPFYKKLGFAEIKGKAVVQIKRKA